MGTGALVHGTSEYTENDPFNLNNQYGLQGFDRKFVFNSYALVEDPWYKNQQGIIGPIARIQRNIMQPGPEKRANRTRTGS